MNMEEITAKIELALNSMRPFLQADGGDVELVDVSPELDVKLRLTGSCSSCEMSHMTMKVGIENGLRAAIPAIKTVTSVD